MCRSGSVPYGGNPGLKSSLLIVTLAVSCLNQETGDFFSVERFSGNESLFSLWRNVMAAGVIKPGFCCHNMV